jgi:hypothetical protein
LGWTMQRTTSRLGCSQAEVKCLMLEGEPEVQGGQVVGLGLEVSSFRSRDGMLSEKVRLMAPLHPVPRRAD